MKAQIKSGKLIIEAEISKRPQPSRSGKTLVSVTTNGFIDVPSDDSKVYSLNLNLIIRR